MFRRRYASYTIRDSTPPLCDGGKRISNEMKAIRIGDLRIPSQAKRLGFVRPPLPFQRIPIPLKQAGIQVFRSPTYSHLPGYHRHQKSSTRR